MDLDASELIQEDVGDLEGRRAFCRRIAGTLDSRQLDEAVRRARGERSAQRSAFRGDVRETAADATWSYVGPDQVPGRITTLAVHPRNPDVLFAGSAAGGVFTTANGGRTWEALWSSQPCLAIGALAIAPSQPAIVYAVTGEWEGNVGTPNNHFLGDGVYRGLEDGQRWEKLPRNISSPSASAMAIDPGDSRRLYVAGSRGLHRSRDGGASWDTRPGHRDGIFDAVISDIVVDPVRPGRLYLGVHTNGVWRSDNGGDDWERLTDGLVVGDEAAAPRIAVRRRADGSTFVAVLSAGRVFVSNDGGDRFTAKTPLPTAFQGYFPWATVVAVDPTNEAILFAGHEYLWRSVDGGMSWTKVGGYEVRPVHADQQALTFHPSNPRRIWLATDGGVFFSDDGGDHWEARSAGLRTTQCFTVAVSRSDPARVGITTQDNGCYISDGGSTFVELPSAGEGGWIEFDPRDATTMYFDTRFRPLQKSVAGAAPVPMLIDACTPLDTDANIREPLAIAPTEPDRLLAVSKPGVIVYRSTNAGKTWTEALRVEGTTITSVEFAPSDARRAVAASADGGVWLSVDGGEHWTKLPRHGLPSAPVHDIEIDPHDPRRVFLAFASLSIAHCWRGDIAASDTDASWSDTSGTPGAALPDLPLTGLAVDPRDAATLYASNILGVYRTGDGGRSWHPFDDGLPNTFVSDLDLQSRGATLYVSTMGRGVYRRRV